MRHIASGLVPTPLHCATGISDDVAIAAAELETGLPRATLRIWERRYGFPRPGRSASGERNYPADQLAKLRLLRWLVDRGHRPGKLMSLSMDELQRLGEEKIQPGQVRQQLHATFVDLLRVHDFHRILGNLKGMQDELGLERFVIDRLAPLNVVVGDAWMNGDIQIYEEHLYTECVQLLLHGVLSALPVPARGGRPRVLLATLTQESHGLGLLMAQVIFSLRGCDCLSLGVRVPLEEIAAAAGAHRADLVGLSCTASVPSSQVLRNLGTLRASLPAQTAIWAGGGCPALYRRKIAGVLALREIDLLPAAIDQYRAEAQA